MRLAHKLSLAQIVLIFGILVLYGALQLHREVHLFQGDMRRDQNETGRGLAAAAADAWKLNGPAAALKLIRDADAAEDEVDIRWIPLDQNRLATHPSWPSPSVFASLLRGESTVESTSQTHGRDSLSTFIPVRVDGTVLGAVQVGESLLEKKQFARATLLHLVGIAAAVGLGAALISALLGASIVVRPMAELVGQARRVGQGDLSTRLGAFPHDEIGQLAGEMNLMCDQLAGAQHRIAQETGARIQALEQLRHADRLATVGTLSSGLAHELGTPLNVVAGRAKMIEGGAIAEEEIGDSARIIREQAERMTGIIRQLLDFARRDRTDRRPGNPREIAGQTLAMLRPLALKRSVSLEMAEEEAPAGEVLMDAGQIKQVLANLIMNAIQSMPHPGKVTVSVMRRRARPPAEYGGGEADHACLQVEDEGCGIPADSLPSIFDPFYTTKGVSEGTGLGLSVSYAIVREHRGWIEVESAVGVGSRFRVYLPLEVDACPAAS